MILGNTLTSNRGYKEIILDVKTSMGALEAVQKGNRDMIEGLTFLKASTIMGDALLKLMKQVEECSEREKRLRENRSNELSLIAKIYNITPDQFSRAISFIHDGMAVRELEHYCRIAVSLTPDDNSEDIWNALFDIWCTAYPEQMIELSTEQLSLLHERSLHKLQSLAGVKCIDTPECLREVYREIGIRKELVDRILGPARPLN